MMTGRPEPIFWKTGNSWSRVAMAVITRLAWMSRVFWASSSPHTPDMMMAGVMTPTTAATTCWSPRGTS